MGKNTLRNVVIAVVVLGGLYALFATDIGSNILEQTGTSGIPQIDFDAGDQPMDTQVFGGTLTVTSKTTDTTDPSVKYGGDTEITTVCYNSNGSSDVDTWTPISTGTSAEDEVITILVTKGTASQGGLVDMWCEPDIGSAQDYYVDIAKVLSENPRVDRAIFDDPNQDNVDGAVFHINLIGIAPSDDPNSAVTMPLYYRLIDEGSLDVDSPTGIGSVATGTGVETNIKWSMDMDNAGDGESLSQVKLRFNSTSDTLWNENQSELKIPFFGTISLAEMVKTDLASTTVYKHTFGNTYADGVMMVTPKTGGDVENLSPFTVVTNFASADGLCIELEIRTVDAQGAFTTNSDDVEVNTAAVGTECTL